MGQPKRAPRLAVMREAILRAAIRAFARAGFQGATMSDVAAEAGYTAPSLYTYFRSKEELLDEVLSFLHAQVMRTFDEPCPSSLSFRQRLELMVQRQLELVDRERQLFLVLQQFQASGAALPTRAARRCLTDFAAYMARLTSWVRQSASDGDLGVHSAEDAAYFLHGIGHARFLRWTMAEARRGGGGAAGGGGGSASTRTATSARLSDDAPLIVDLFLNGLSGSGCRPTGKGAR